MRRNVGMLVSELQHRDPQDDLSDVDCGRYLDAIQRLPQNTRQLLQEGDMHCELREIDDRYRVVKVVKKREPEFLQGSERHFVFDQEGQRIPLTENEFDKALGLAADPDDIYETDHLQLETINSESVPPLDRWDVTYDASEFLNEAQRFIRNWNEGITDGIQDPVKHMEDLANQLIYSADWFPYAADKRIHGSRAREIARKIISGEIKTKQQLGATLGPKVTDRRPQKVKELRSRAEEKEPGRGKAALLIRANKIVDKYCKDLRSLERQPDPISDSDRAKLWALWRMQRMKDDGEVKLMPWQFEKAYGAKLKKQITAGEITHEQANRMLTERMQQHFGQKPQLITRDIDLEMPVWLKEAPLPPLTMEDDYEFTATGWLANPSSLMDEPEEDWQDYISNVLLDGGE